MAEKFDHYQRKTQETAIYPEDKALEYLALGLYGEAVEYAEKIKKHIRDGKELYGELLKEFGEVHWDMNRVVCKSDA